ncbi:MAG: LysR family transcriptional regulator [Sphaerochaeta sp.]|jgi:DNA-binding transcriptional LysR family regulator|nr:LysR family transcriptional regulator [Sphaerochaeta sp.]
MDARITTFLTICQTMNFTKAARKLALSQPAVTQQIHSLEAEFGVSLFDRTSRAITLTVAGRLLRDVSVTQADDEALLRSQMRRTEEQPPLTLGATRTIADFAVAKPLAGFLGRHPESRIRLKVDNTRSLLSAIRDGVVQCALVEGSYDPTLFDAMPWRSEEYLAVCAASHQFPAEPRMLGDLLGERLIIREPGSGTRQIMEDVLRLENHSLSQFPHVTEVGSMMTVLECVEQDAGVSFMYRLAAEQGIASGALRVLPLRGFPLYHDFTMVWNRGSRFADRYRSLCRELNG